MSYYLLGGLRISKHPQCYYLVDLEIILPTRPPVFARITKMTVAFKGH